MKLSNDNRCDIIFSACAVGSVNQCVSQHFRRGLCDRFGNVAVRQHIGETVGTDKQPIVLFQREPGKITLHRRLNADRAGDEMLARMVARFVI